VPSSKNSKQWTGKILISNKPTLQYEKHNIWYYIQAKNLFKKYTQQLPKPLHIGFHFIRETKHKFDFINALQIVQDMMVKTEWIEDDNMHCLIPYAIHLNSEHFSYDKNKPGVIIKVLNSNHLDLSLDAAYVNQLITQVYQASHYSK